MFNLSAKEWAIVGAGAVACVGVGAVAEHFGEKAWKKHKAKKAAKKAAVTVKKTEQVPDTAPVSTQKVAKSDVSVKTPATEKTSADDAEDGIRVNTPPAQPLIQKAEPNPDILHPEEDPRFDLDAAGLTVGTVLREGVVVCRGEDSDALEDAQMNGLPSLEVMGQTIPTVGWKTEDLYLQGIEYANGRSEFTLTDSRGAEIDNPYEYLGIACGVTAEDFGGEGHFWIMHNGHKRIYCVVVT